MQGYTQSSVQKSVTLMWLLGISAGTIFLGFIINSAFPPEEGELGLIKYLMLPSGIMDFIYQPWGWITYAFISPIKVGEHTLLFTILLNFVFIYQFGRLLESHIGTEKLQYLIGFSILFIGLTTMLICSGLPGVDTSDLYLFGMSGLSTAIITACITLIPKYPMRLMIFGNVAIIFLGIAIIGFKAIAIYSWKSNAEFFSIILGIATGFGYIKLLKMGNDIPEMIFSPLKSAFDNQRRTKMEIVRDEPDAPPRQAEIDAILDKIARDGYEKLTRKEKERLAQFSQDNSRKER